MQWLIAARPVLGPVIQAALTAGLLAVGLPQACVVALPALVARLFGL